MNQREYHPPSMTHAHTIRHLLDRDRDALTHALRDAAIFGRDDLTAIRVTGKDREKYLHNMLTQDVTGLDVGSVRPACLCDAQGKILGLMTLIKEQDQLWLWTQTTRAEDLRDRLDRYVIMDECELILEPDLAAVTVVGPQVAALDVALGLRQSADALTVTVRDLTAQTWLTQTGDCRPGHAQVAERWFVVDRGSVPALVEVLQAQGAHIGCHAAVEALRILSGQPLLGADIEDGSLPIEVGLRPSVSYRKGCYVGQEAIAMMTYRGQLRRHLAWVEVVEGAPLPGWQLRTLDGKRAGKMGSALDLGPSVIARAGLTLGLATIQRKCFEPGAELLAKDDADETGASVARVRIVATTTPDVFAAAEAA